MKPPYDLPSELIQRFLGFHRVHVGSGRKAQLAIGFRKGRLAFRGWIWIWQLNVVSQFIIISCCPCYFCSLS
jgi:hypothetical protein